MATVSTNLPAPLTRFVGREAELAEAAALLGEARLLTLVGPGGAGKTRLALRLAAEAGRDFPDGVWFVDLSPLADGNFVWDKVAATVGAPEPGPGSRFADTLGRHLAPRQALIVLDNCEHVVESAAEVGTGLLTAAPGLKILATSREPLGVGGEMTWTVPPLSEADALDLFADRARQAWPQFKLRDGDIDAVLYICRRLDGLPLAIELAAARTRALDPNHIAAGLRERFALLQTGPRSAPRRQSTLAASFDWSFDLLANAERALLRQLSVFAGGFDVDAALGVCPSGSLELVAALTDRSLIKVEGRSGRGESRYRMLETVREFAAEHLDEAEEVEMIRIRHRDYYLVLVETAEPKLVGPDQEHWRARLFAEQDNLRAAMAFSRERGDVEALARMVVALAGFWLNSGGVQMSRRLTDLHYWLEAAAERASDVPPPWRARLRNYQCLDSILNVQRFEDVPALANEALALARASGNKREEAFALMNLGLVAGMIGGSQAMRPYVEEALPLARSTGFAWGVAGTLVLYVMLRWLQSGPDETRRLAEEALVFAKTGAEFHNQLLARVAAGMTALVQGRLDDAADLFGTNVELGRDTNDSNYIGGLVGLGMVKMFRGEFAGARLAVEEGVAAARRMGTEVVSIAMIAPIAQLILGWMHLSGGDAAQARTAVSPVADALRSSRLPRYASLPLLVLAEAELALGALNEAEATLNEATSLARQGELTWILGRAALIRAKVRARQGDMQEAESLAHEALTLGREAGDQMGVIDGLEELAQLAAVQDSKNEAVRLWAAADSRRTEIGYRFAIDRGKQDAALARAKGSVGADEFDSAWAAGAKLSANEAIAYAARGRGERKRPTAGWASLTPSELAVVRLVGEHLSNPEIAARLFVSRATVKTHLVHIFSKLGVDSRSELAAAAIRRGIAPQPEQPLQK